MIQTPDITEDENTDPPAEDDDMGIPEVEPFDLDEVTEEDDEV